MGDDYDLDMFIDMGEKGSMIADGPINSDTIDPDMTLEAEPLLLDAADCDLDPEEILSPGLEDLPEKKIGITSFEELEAPSDDNSLILESDDILVHGLGGTEKDGDVPPEGKENTLMDLEALPLNNSPEGFEPAFDEGTMVLGLEEIAPKELEVPLEKEDIPPDLEKITKGPEFGLPEELASNPAILEGLSGLSKDDIQKNIKAYRELSPEAKEIYDTCLANEPSITADMRELAEANNGRLAGEEYRVKFPGSYSEKIGIRAEQKGLSETEDLDTVNDILRYTQIYDPVDLAGSVESSLGELEDKGYQVDSIKNSWNDPYSPYKGVNCSLVSPQGIKLEMQYHTPGSFDVKNGEMHRLYEEYRLLDSSSPQALELEDRMFALSDALTVPRGIGGIKSR